VGPDGSLYVADSPNQRVRRVWPADESGVRVITTFAGNGVHASTGDGGLATEASLEDPEGVAVAADGSVYIAEFNVPGRVRRVNPCGIIETAAGGGNGFIGDGGPALDLRLDGPSDVAVGPDGNVYIAQWWGGRILKLAPDGTISTVAGGVSGNPPLQGDGGPATQAKLNFTRGVTVAPDGTIYIADTGNRRVRRVGNDGIITAVAGTGVIASTGDGGLALRAELEEPYGITTIPNGDVYVSDFGDARIREIRMPLPRFEGGEFYRAALDGRTVDIYSQLGRHLRTVDFLSRS
jgi:hypothetical protein